MNGHVIARHALKTAEIITTILDGLSGPFPVLQPVVGLLQKIVDIAGVRVTPSVFVVPYR